MQWLSVVELYTHPTSPVELRQAVATGLGKLWRILLKVRRVSIRVDTCNDRLCSHVCVPIPPFFISSERVLLWRCVKIILNTAHILDYSIMCRLSCVCQWRHTVCLLWVCCKIEQKRFGKIWLSQWVLSSPLWHPLLVCAYAFCVDTIRCCSAKLHICNMCQHTCDLHVICVNCLF